MNAERITTVGRMDIPRGEFRVCQKDKDGYICFFQGKLEELEKYSEVIKQVIEITDEGVYFVAHVYDYELTSDSQWKS